MVLKRGFLFHQSRFSKDAMFSRVRKVLTIPSVPSFAIMLKLSIVLIDHGIPLLPSIVLKPSLCSSFLPVLVFVLQFSFFFHQVDVNGP